MARPSKRNLDYFMHSALPSKTKRMILARHGTSGIGMYWLMMEMISLTDNHCLDLREDEEWKYFVDHVALGDEKTIIEILNWLAERDKIDPVFWEQRIIWSDPFVERNAEAYSRRSEPISSKPKLKNSKLVFAYINRVDDGNMPTETELMYTETKLMPTETGLLYHRADKSRKEQIRTDKKRATDSISAAALFDNLLSLPGVGKVTANSWIDIYGKNLVAEKFGIIQDKISNGKCKDPGAMMRRALEEDWKPKRKKPAKPSTPPLAEESIQKLVAESEQQEKDFAKEQELCEELWGSMDQDRRSQIEQEVQDRIRDHNGPVSGMFQNWLENPDEPQPPLLKIAATNFRNEILLKGMEAK